MDDLIKREDALAAIDTFKRDFKQSWRVQFSADIRALPAVDTAAIREAAWVEALDAAHEYTLTQYGMGFLKHPVDRERILALIGEKK